MLYDRKYDCDHMTEIKFVIYFCTINVAKIGSFNARSVPLYHRSRNLADKPCQHSRRRKIKNTMRPSIGTAMAFSPDLPHAKCLNANASVRRITIVYTVRNITAPPGRVSFGGAGMVADLVRVGRRRLLGRCGTVVHNGRLIIKS